MHGYTVSIKFDVRFFNLVLKTTARCSHAKTVTLRYIFCTKNTLVLLKYDPSIIKESKPKTKFSSKQSKWRPKEFFAKVSVKPKSKNSKTDEEKRERDISPAISKSSTN